ncbi:MAG: LEPR-XLL domain-containing protein, partial [Phycisphaerae bacterium]
MRVGRLRRLDWTPLFAEALEPRLLLSSTPTIAAALADPALTAFLPTYRVIGKPSAQPYGSSGPVGLTPTQIRHAYGFDQITFSNGTIVGDGTGQTIAIIDAYNAPTIVQDLHTFDLAFGIPDPANFTIVSQTGSTTNLPSNAPTPGNSWAVETSLDVEWAHALAPGANILLVEANSASLSDLLSAAVGYARTVTGVVAITMSFGTTDGSSLAGYNSLFTTPTGHAGITFLASTGDSGSPGSYPAYAPTVVAVGGTTLLTDGSGNYINEAGWSGSGGGVSTYQAAPSFQVGLTGYTNRT